MRPVTITFKKGCEEEAKECLDLLDELDRKRPNHPRVLATGVTDDGRRTIMVRFDDGLDYLAFRVHIGGAKIVDGPDTIK